MTRAEGRISYGHLGRTNLLFYQFCPTANLPVRRVPVLRVNEWTHHQTCWLSGTGIVLQGGPEKTAQTLMCYNLLTVTETVNELSYYKYKLHKKTKFAFWGFTRICAAEMAVRYAALCRKVYVCHCNSLGGATWRSITGRTDRRTDRQTDGQTECDALCGPLLGRRAA